MKRVWLNKKAAIELSMTTIIVIIIGITLLSLGLIWVKSTFSNATDISDKAFEQAQGTISDIFEQVDEPVYVSPPSVKVEQGSAKNADLIITNFEEEQIKVKANIRSSDQKLKCLFADTDSQEFKTTSQEYTLNSGKAVKIKLIIDSDKTTNLGTKACNIEVPALEDSNTQSLIIEVVKKQGLFS